MTFQPVRIVLVPEEDGTVRNCYISVGKFLVTRDIWIDPMLAYRKLSNEEIEKKKKAEKPFSLRRAFLTDFEKAPWKNADLVAIQKKDSAIIRPWVIEPGEKTEDTFQEIALFGGTTLKQDTGINGIYTASFKMPEAFLS